jgi:hypothetical protein
MNVEQVAVQRTPDEYEAMSGNHYTKRSLLNVVKPKAKYKSRAAATLC